MTVAGWLKYVKEYKQWRYKFPWTGKKAFKKINLQNVMIVYFIPARYNISALKKFLIIYYAFLI